MSDFFVNIWAVISGLAWFDWFVIAMFLLAVVFGFVKGWIFATLNFGFFVLAVFGAIWLYKPISDAFLTNTELSFNVSFWAVIICCSIIMIIIKWLASNATPYALNRFFALLVLVVILGFISINNVAVISDFLTFIDSPNLQLLAAFSIIWISLIILSLLTFRAFNITIGHQPSGVLLPIYSSIFNASAAINNTVNNTDISISSKISGAVIGIVYMALLIIFLGIISDNIVLGFLQSLTVIIKSFLAQYLSFI